MLQKIQINKLSYLSQFNFYRTHHTVKLKLNINSLKGYMQCKLVFFMLLHLKRKDDRKKPHRNPFDINGVTALQIRLFIPEPEIQLSQIRNTRYSGSACVTSERGRWRRIQVNTATKAARV